MTIGRVEVWVCSPTKLKKLKKNKPKAEQETAQPTAARFKKPKAILEPRPPSAARLKKNKPKAKHDRARLRLRGNKPKAD